MINKFRGKYAFLSNFYPCLIEYNGLQFRSVESAYQAQKTLDNTIREEFTRYDSRKAKAESKSLTVREDWNRIKLQIMSDLLLIKFADSNLQKKLLDTGDIPLIEENTWHDLFWGVCECERCEGRGTDWLGKLLMRTRLHYECCEYY